MDLNQGDTRLIIETCKRNGLPIKQAAYVLATAWHETAHKMKPIREMGGEKYLRAKKYYPYVGMGYVQLTWEANYRDWSSRLGVDFLKNPKLLLVAEHAVRILVEGMKLGTFTGKKLSYYINDRKTDFKGARRIINGTDRSALIAGHAQEYVALLAKDGYGAATAPKPTPKPKDDNMVLKLGDEGKYVEDLQNHLNTLGFGPLTVSGEFDKATENAVGTFQSMNGLKADAIVGIRTSTAIGEALKAQEVAPKLMEAEKNVPPTATKEVKEKTNFGAWAMSLFGVGGTSASAAFSSDWTTVLAVAGAAIVALIVILLMRRQIIAAFKEINQS